jgi:hypothetical protein
MVGLEDSAHPTVKKLRSALPIPVLDDFRLVGYREIRFGES